MLLEICAINMAEKVYIIILNYNGWQDTIECLESVFKIDYDNYQVIVVDNNSPNKSMEKIVSWAKGDLEAVLPESSTLKHLCLPFEKKTLPFILYSKGEVLLSDDAPGSISRPPLILIQSDDNRGFAAGNNIGINHALAKNDGDFFWLLNNDTIVPKDSLANLLASFQKNKHVGLCGCKILDYFVPSRTLGLCGCYSVLSASPYHIYSYSNYKKVKNRVGELYPIGASMICSKDFLNRVGLLNEEYFLYFEELDWVERAKKQNVEIGFDFSAYIYHKEGGTIGLPLKKGPNFFSVMWLARAHKKYVKKYKNRCFLFWFYLIHLMRILKNLFFYRNYSRALFYSIFTDKEAAWIAKKMTK